MKCFLCQKTELEIVLVKLPVETMYRGIWFEMIGNARPNEFACLACIGYQFDWLKVEQRRDRIS